MSLLAMSLGCMQIRHLAPPSLEVEPVAADERCLDAFDRNALRQVVLAGDRILSRTASGLILRFDAADLRPSGEVWPPSPASYLGKDHDGTVLVASVNGVVARLDPETDRLTPMGRLDGEPVWAGTAARLGSVAALVGIVRRHERVRPSRWWEAEDRYLAATTREFPLHLAGEVHVVFQSSEGALYLGTDLGEFGGMVQVVDLPAWTTRVLCGYEPPEQRCPGGVYGFVETQEGEVLAYGGAVHLGTGHRFVAKVGDEGLEPLAEQQADFELTAERAMGPLSRMLALPDGGFLGIVFDRVIHVDRTMAQWSDEGSLGATFLPGHPYSAGPGAPVLDAALLLGDPPILVAATAREGLILFRAGHRSSGRLPGQCPAQTIEAIGRWDGNLLAAGREDATEELVACRRTGTGWSGEPLPVPPELATTALGPDLEGVRVRALATRADGSTLAVYARDWVYRPTVTISWHDGIAEIVDRSDLDVVHMATGADGTLWADDLFDLYRLEPSAG
jgi:hypothetical protein